MPELSLELKNRLKEIAKILVDSDGSANSPELFRDLEITADLLPEVQIELNKQIKTYMLSKVKISVGGYTSKKSASERNKGKSIIDSINDYTVIDLETTSKYPTSAEIIELSAVRVRSGQITEKFTQLVKPSKPVSKVITDLTGITNEMLSDAPPINEVIQNFIDFIGDDIIIGHNIVNYDYTILYNICENLNLKILNNDMIDTIKFAKSCDIDFPDYKLVTLTEYFGIEHNAHRALNDCIANFEVYEKLKKAIQQKKESSLSDKNFEQYLDISGFSIVLTGEFKIGRRDDVKAMLEEWGAKVTNSVSKKTSYLILGALGNHGSKLDKAKEIQAKGYPIKIVKEEEFFKGVNI